MNNSVVLDGYNVIHAVPELARQLDRSLESARAALISLCGAYRARRGDVERLQVVFDGSDADVGGPRENQHGITVLFTRQGEEADERILSLLRAEGSHGRFIVVSNDTEVTNNARALGAQVLSADQFYGQTQPAGSKRPKQLPIEKAPLSTLDAQRITEEYRKHLDRKSK